MGRFKIIYALVLLLITGLSYAAEKQKVVETQISQVTIYLSGAQVSRNADIDLAVGTTDLRFIGISPNIDLNSVQVSLPTDVKIMSVNKRYVSSYTEPQYRKRWASLKDSILLLSDDLQVSKSLQTINMTEQNMLTQNIQRLGESGGVTTSELQQATSFYRSKLTTLHKGIHALNLTIRSKERSLNGVKARQARLRLKAIRPAYEIIVSAKTSIEKRVKANITYVVLMAGWAPKYEVRSKGVDQPIDFRYRAEVINNSKVDWENVVLTLSTADPSESMKMPELTPWTIDFYNGGNFKSSYQTQVEQKQSLSNKLFDDGSFGNASPSPGSRTRAPANSSASIEVSDLSVEFEIKEPYTIPADNEYYLVDVNQYDLKASYHYRAIPKLDKDAFLVAKIVGWESLNLIEGEMSLYNSGTFAGSSYLNPRYSNDTLELSLGRDKKVLVKRNQIKDFTKNQFIGGSRKEQKIVEITLRNTNTEEVDIVLKEQIPISKNADIAITLENSSEATYDKELGELTWSLVLKPSETKKIRLSYEMKYPKKKRVASTGVYRTKTQQKNSRSLYRK